MNTFEQLHALTSRRAFLTRATTGIGAAALATMLDPSLVRGANTADPPAGRGVINPLHFAPKARRVIFLSMAGGPSHLETFDYKPMRGSGAPTTSGGMGIT